MAMSEAICSSSVTLGGLRLIRPERSWATADAAKAINQYFYLAHTGHAAADVSYPRANVDYPRATRPVRKPAPDRDALYQIIDLVGKRKAAPDAYSAQKNRPPQGGLFKAKFD